MVWHKTLDTINIYFCAGSILNEWYILTTATCVKDFAERGVELYVRAGATSKIQGGTVHKVKKCKIHEKFDKANHRNDIAVLKLEKPIDLDHTTKEAIELVDNVGLYFDKASAAGWGSIQGVDLKYVDPLQGVKMNIVNTKSCNETYDMRLLEGQICAAKEYSYSVSVYGFGDTGAPLVAGGKLAGILSFPHPRKDAPDVFTEILHYIDWIKSNMKN